MEIKELRHRLEKRVMVLDGAMGTMIQQLNLREDDYRGKRWTGHDRKLFGCNDLLCLTHPESIVAIHRAYIEAGADIISTNTFNANAVSLADYGLDKDAELIREINRAGAVLARKAADCGNVSDRRVFVVGSIGPTNRTASMSPDVEDPALRNVTYNELYAAYTVQTEGLIAGGVDLLLFETVFDTLNLKAGLAAADDLMERLGVRLPIMVSATVSDKAGRTLSGQTLKAFITSVEEYDNVVSIGLNCSFGPADIYPYIREVSGGTAHYVSCHPNAGLPNAMGEYDETPGSFATHMKRILDGRLVNIVGGCCGTTPEHIRALVADVAGAVPRKPAVLSPALRVSGLEMVEITPANNFVNIGERCNVAGSRKFLRLIKEKNYEEAMQIAAGQVEDGAMIIDVNMDDALLDASDEMVHFLRYISSDPEIAKVPVMVDSSDWKVVEAALKNLQGKGIVNSISLKEGEEVFIRRARMIRRLGAAVIVMAFDEKGQADTYERKIEICRRAYDLLTGSCGYNPEDIIFDVNIMAVATGIEAHDRYGIDFIHAVKWVKENLPGARTSGGVSNLSFAFRGKNAIREAMHAVFLYHAIRNGLDMAILNPATSVTYENIDPDLLEIIEDVILCRRAGAVEKLAAYAASDTANPTVERGVSEHGRTMPVEERLTESLVRGNSRYLTDDLAEALAGGMTAVGIIQRPLMTGMNRVGDLFGEGKMFLPQVVKSARTMKIAVDYLTPYLESGKKPGDAGKGKVVFATVKGDVHDIGKNICSIVLACNNYEVIDLGVMVSAETIVDTVRRENPDIVCLSGLITPSLAEMVNVARALKEAGISVPILVGGATTSRLHTALRIAGEYDGPVVHVADASQNPIVAGKLLSPATSEAYIVEIKDEYARLREEYEMGKEPLVTLADARVTAEVRRKRRTSILPSIGLNKPEIIDIPLSEIIPLIDWKMLFHAWRMEGRYMEDFPYDLCDGCVARLRTSLQSLSTEEATKGEEALKLYRDAIRILGEISGSGEYDGKGAVGFYRAWSDGDDLVIGGDMVIPLLRQQRKGSGFRSLADYVSRKDDAEDYVGVFAVTAGHYITDLEAGENDAYRRLLLQTLADRLAEASSEWLHSLVRRKLWGYAGNELPLQRLPRGEYEGIRPAMGYPMLPDQLLNHNLAALLPLDKLGVSLTENGAMSPSSSVSGLYIAAPDAAYFMIGEIGADQLEDYARRRGEPLERIKEILRQ